MSIIRRAERVEPRVPAHLVHRDPEYTAPVSFAPRRAPLTDDPRLAQLADAIEAMPNSPPSPLSEAARKLVCETAIARAEMLRDQMKAVMDERCKEIVADCKARVEEAMSVKEQWSRWGDDYVISVRDECEEVARKYQRDLDIFHGCARLVEGNGLPLPPRRPATALAPAATREGELEAQTEAAVPEDSMVPRSLPARDPGWEPVFRLREALGTVHRLA